MGTTWSEVITKYGMTQINDIRLNQQAAENPALFYRIMSEYLENAITLFTCPPEEQEWLTGTPPTYADTTWTAPAPKAPEEEGEPAGQADGEAEEPTEPVTPVDPVEPGEGDGEDKPEPEPEPLPPPTAWQLDTGFLNYEMMSVVEEQTTRSGDLVLVPYTGADYDAETGRVTFPDDTPEGTKFRLDFYTDGIFDRDLSLQEMRILGLCVKEIWTEHFSADWLNMQPKVNDKSFNVGSEANHIRSMTERGKAVSSALYSEMKKYEQNLAYQRIVRNRRPPLGPGR